MRARVMLASRRRSRDRQTTNYVGGRPHHAGGFIDPIDADAFDAALTSVLGGNRHPGYASAVSVTVNRGHHCHLRPALPGAAPALGCATTISFRTSGSSVTLRS